MDDPTPRSKKDWETERTFGALDPKRGPLFFSSCAQSQFTQIPRIHSQSPKLKIRPPRRDRRRDAPFHLELRDGLVLRIHDAEYRNLCQPENVDHFGGLEPRRVVLK